MLHGPGHLLLADCPLAEHAAERPQLLQPALHWQAFHAPCLLVLSLHHHVAIQTLLDQELVWTVRLHHTECHQSQQGLNLHAGMARRLRGHRWLVIACDTKILMQDLASNAIREIPRSVLDSKTPTCLAILYIVASRLLTGDCLHSRVCLLVQLTIWPNQRRQAKGTIIILHVIQKPSSDFLPKCFGG